MNSFASHRFFFYPRENFVTGRLFIRLSSKNEMFQVRVIFQTCGIILILDTLRFHEKFEQMNPCVIEKSFSIQDRCCCTVWNFQDFSYHLDFSWNQFYHFEASKTAIFTILAALNFESLGIFDIFKCEIPLRTKFKASKTVQMTVLSF